VFTISFSSSKKALGAHILTTHPNMSRDDAKKATGYNHRIQGKIGKQCELTITIDSLSLKRLKVF
jgi:hypothetical protein